MKRENGRCMVDILLAFTSRQNPKKVSSLKYIVIVSFSCRLGTVGKSETSLKDCFHCIVLFTCLWRHLLIINEQECFQPTVDCTILGQMDQNCIKSYIEQARGSKLISRILPQSLLQFLAASCCLDSLGDEL